MSGARLLNKRHIHIWRDLRGIQKIIRKWSKLESLETLFMVWQTMTLVSRVALVQIRFIGSNQKIVCFCYLRTTTRNGCKRRENDTRFYIHSVVNDMSSGVYWSMFLTCHCPFGCLSGYISCGTELYLSSLSLNYWEANKSCTPIWRSAWSYLL